MHLLWSNDAGTLSQLLVGEGGGRCSYFSLLTTVGMPQYVTVQELRCRVHVSELDQGSKSVMSDPLFVSERPKPQITERPLSVGCFISDSFSQLSPTSARSDQFRA